MPEIGEVRFSKDCGKKRGRFIWHACIECGKERWVKLFHNLPKSNKCRGCSNGMKGKIISDGRHLNDDGYYILLLRPDDFYFSMATKPRRKQASRYVLEHRLVMAKSLGRCLQGWEFVHHKNGDRSDNRIENLELTTCGQHILDHHKGYKDGYQKGLTDGKDAKIKQLEARIKELQEAKEFSRKEIASFFGVPPHKSGVTQ